MPYIPLFLAALIAAATFFLALALIVDGAADVIKNGKPCWGRLAGAAACLSGGLLALLLATAF